MLSNVSDNISMIIRFCPYTQYELSKKLDISQTHISRLLNNLVYPRIIDIIKFSLLFGISTDDLLFKKVVYIYNNGFVIRDK